MRTAFIINDCEHESLLRFTETKLFYDAKNNGIDFIDDCVIIDESEIPKTSDDLSIIMTAGDFLTTEFREKHRDYVGILDTRNLDNVIRFKKDTNISFKKKIDYEQGSKQLYIVENMLKVCSKSTKLIYLENTESKNIRPVIGEHFFGVASGWKSMLLACANDFRSVTIYDVNERQLEFAQYLHGLKELPIDIGQIPNSYGSFNPSADVYTNWNKWHNMDVNFKKLDLFKLPIFPNNSFVWISNVFHYESNIFKYGWKICQDSYKSLISINEGSIITTT